jgi:hypothetical protein
MVTVAEAILIGVLERCGRSPRGYRLDNSNEVVAELLARGWLTVRRGGNAVTTEKGKLVLKAIIARPEQRKEKRKVRTRTRLT